MALQTGLFDYSVNYALLDVIDPNDPMFSQEVSGNVALVNMKLHHNFNLGYSHDLNTSRFSTITKSVHEIMLRYKIPVRGNSQVPKTNFY
jgi:hypothetical protein